MMLPYTLTSNRHYIQQPDIKGHQRLPLKSIQIYSKKFFLLDITVSLKSYNMRVKFFPWQPHCFAFGGFDMQMLDTLDSIKNVGVDASKLDIWSRDNNFDIIHLWGVGMLNYHV